MKHTMDLLQYLLLNSHIPNTSLNDLSGSILKLIKDDIDPMSKFYDAIDSSNEIHQTLRGIVTSIHPEENNPDLKIHEACMSITFSIISCISLTLMPKSTLKYAPSTLDHPAYYLTLTQILPEAEAIQQKFKTSLKTANDNKQTIDNYKEMGINYDFSDILTSMLAIHASDNRIKLLIHPNQRCILQYDKSAEAEIQSIKIFSKRVKNISKDPFISSDNTVHILFTALIRLAGSTYNLFKAYHSLSLNREEAENTRDLLNELAGTIATRATLHGKESTLSYIEDQKKKGPLVFLSKIGPKVALPIITAFINDCLRDSTAQHPSPTKYIALYLVWGMLAKSSDYFLSSTVATESLFTHFRDELTRTLAEPKEKMHGYYIKAVQLLLMITQTETKALCHESKIVAANYLQCAELATKINSSCVDMFTLRGGNWGGIKITDEHGNMLSNQKIGEHVTKRASIEPRTINHQGGSLRELTLWLQGQPSNRLPKP
ncbi:hypothetical protein OAT84_01945 [Gammaproteobacteria bacterium]|nr:hypothetical protein [Gammaproteobacteria bacterium]